MAALLGRAYAIPIIGLSLVLDSRKYPPEPVGVRVEVDLPDGPRLLVDVSLEDLGLRLDLPSIDAALAAGLRLTLPNVLEELQAALETVGPDEPVWLEFRRPFGFLPALPWERLLDSYVARPLLRLPFSSVPAVAGTDAFAVAVCSPWPGATELYEFLSVVAPRLPSQTRIHVFTRDETVRDHLAAGTDVVIHGRPSATRGRRLPSQPDDDLAAAGVESPWLRWMAEAIAPDSIDVLHLVVPAGLSQNFGMLDFGPAPNDDDSPRNLRVVSLSQLLAGVTRLGAWSVSFAVPGVSRSSRPHGEAGLRILAHRLTGLISGPVLLQAPVLGNAEELLSAYGFLYATHPTPPRRAPTITLACHPANLRALTTPTASYEPGVLAQELDSAMERFTLDQQYVGMQLRGPMEPPAWLASSQRMLERWTSGLIGSDADPLEAQAQAGGVAAALSFIASTIEGSVRDEEGRT